MDQFARFPANAAWCQRLLSFPNPSTIIHSGSCKCMCFTICGDNCYCFDVSPKSGTCLVAQCFFFVGGTLGVACGTRQFCLSASLSVHFVGAAIFGTFSNDPTNIARINDEHVSSDDSTPTQAKQIHLILIGQSPICALFQLHCWSQDRRELRRHETPLGGTSPTCGLGRQKEQSGLALKGQQVRCTRFVDNDGV